MVSFVTAFETSDLIIIASVTKDRLWEWLA